MRWMALVLGLGLVSVGCSKKSEEPVDVKTDDEETAEEGSSPADEAAKKAKEEAEAADEGQTKTDKDDDAKDDDGAKKDDDDAKPTSTAAAKATAGSAPPFGAGGLAACCAALDAQSKASSGSNQARLKSASQQCFHLDGLVAQGKTTKGAALSQIKALAGSAPAACN